MILIKPTLKKCIKVKGIKADLGKKNLSCSIVNTIGGKHLRALRRPNKNRNNRTKRLVLLNICPSE